MAVAREHEPAAAPEAEAVRVGPAPDADITRLASLIGNHAFTRAVARQPGAGSPQPPAAPVVARQEEGDEEPGLNEGQKVHLKSQVIVPMRSGAGRLVGDKPDTRSIVRHLKPLQGTMRGFAAKGEAANTLRGGADELGALITILDSLNLSHKQAIFLARNAWQTSRRQLAKTKVEIAKLAKAQKVDAADLAEVNSQIDALSQQIAATSQDLAEAPRTQEGFKAVVETAGGLIEQFTSFTSQGGDVPPSFREAQKTFVEGLARILPLSGTKAEAIDMVRTSLTDLANRLAPLAGEEAEEAKEEKDDAKKGPDPDEPDPHAAQPIAPPGPSPLPPPPLPPGKKPVPAGT